MNASINAIGASPGVASALGVTPEAFLEADDAVRWSAVGDELRAMLQGVIAANLTRLHHLGPPGLSSSPNMTIGSKAAWRMWPGATW